MANIIKKNPISNDLWAWIKYRLTQAGYPSFRALGKAYDYSDVSFKIVKNYAFPNTEKIIANIIGLTPQDLFPNRYQADGTPIGRNYPREIRLSERRKRRNGKDKKRNNHEKED